jgi:hypothetical protein
MAKTPDRFPGRLIEDVEIFFDTPADSAPSGPGVLTYDPTAQAFRLQDGVGVFNPHDLNQTQHEDLRSLTHNLAVSHEQVLTMSSDGIITAVAAQEIGGGNGIRDYDSVTFNADGLLTGCRIRQRNAAGTVTQTLTASISIAGGLPTKNTVTRT